ncbi:MAG: AAA family ATPase [Deltaproteobacteria bacterium]
MSYLNFFGFNMEPFSNVAMGKFYFNSPQHARALAKLAYAADSMKGLALLVGNIGAGKTTLARRFLDSLPEDKYEAALIVMVHSAVTSDWLLKKIAHQMGIDDPSPDKLKLMGQLYERLISIRESGKKAVVLVDEAQMLQSKEIMEEFRGMLNLESEDSKLISFIFFGLPEVDQNLKLDEPLAQRVAIRIALEAMHEKETEEYIKHRLATAGNGNIQFTTEALSIIYKYSNGIPRLINTMCDNALLEAFLLKKKEINKELLTGVLEDLGLAMKSPRLSVFSAKSETITKEEAAKAAEKDEVDLMFQGLEIK